jgi:TetR/AcrR family transcriptional repressor of nem operon
VLFRSYGHFASKDALAAEAIAAAIDDGRRLLEDRGLTAYLHAYLSRRHRDRPDEGCPLLAFAGSHEPRGSEVDAALASGAARLLDEATERLDERPDETQEARSRRACGLFATAIGGQILARLVAGQAPALSDAILSAAREEIGRRLLPASDEATERDSTPKR